MSWVTLSIAQWAFASRAPASPAVASLGARARRSPARYARRPRFRAARAGRGTGARPRRPRRTQSPPRSGRPEEADVGASGVGAVALDGFDRAHRVALRRGHLRAVAGDHALGEQVRERLLDVEHRPCPRAPCRRSARTSGAGSRARRRRCTGRPASSSRRPRGPRALVVVRVEVAQEVPGGVDEGVHRVGLAARRRRRTSGRSCRPSPRPPRAGSCPSARSPRRRAARPGAGRRGPGRCRPRSQ